MNNFRHQIKIQIRFGDIDLIGHVNHAVFLTYMELARIHYFNDVVGKEIDWSETGIIIARAEVDFKSPVFLTDEELFVYTRCSRFGNKSFDLSYRIEKVQTGEEAASGMTAVVAYNYKSKKTIHIPDEWKKKMEEFENP
ncbi:MAG: acyl-CoA thioesterase [Bacteroidetes bacterium]|nr:acyl-CoA thioesterase [Bacteroidota bacterium]